MPPSELDAQETARTLQAVARTSGLPDTEPFEKRVLMGIANAAFLQPHFNAALLLGLALSIAALVIRSRVAVVAIVMGTWLAAMMSGTAAAKQIGRLAGEIFAAAGEKPSPARMMAAYDLLVPNRHLAFLRIIVAALVWLVGLILVWSERGPAAAFTIFLLFMTWRGMGRGMMLTARQAFRKAAAGSPAARSEAQELLDYEEVRFQRVGRPRWVDAPFRLERRELLFSTSILLSWIWTVTHPGVLAWIYTAAVTALWLAWVVLRAREAPHGNVAVCRAARAARASRYLARHHAAANVLDAVWLAFGCVALVDPGTPMPWVLLPAPFLAFGTTVCLVPATLTVLKALLTGGLKIVVFRRFRREHMDQHRQIILPALGAYGSVVALADPTLASAQPGPSAFTADVLSGASDFEMSGDDWLVDVRLELRDADLVVFHWPERPTEAMVQELYAAQESVPPSRLLWITSSAGVEEVNRWLYKAALPAMPQQVLSIDGEATLAEVTDAVYPLISALKPEPRPHARSGGPGTTPPPAGP